MTRSRDGPACRLEVNGERSFPAIFDRGQDRARLPSLACAWPLFRPAIESHAPTQDLAARTRRSSELRARCSSAPHRGRGSDPVEGPPPDLHPVERRIQRKEWRLPTNRAPRDPHDLPLQVPQGARAPDAVDRCCAENGRSVVRRGNAARDDQVDPACPREGTLRLGHSGQLVARGVLGTVCASWRPGGRCGLPPAEPEASNSRPARISEQDSHSLPSMRQHFGQCFAETLLERLQGTGAELPDARGPATPAHRIPGRFRPWIRRRLSESSADSIFYSSAS